ncbi:MAG: PLP-dependent aspartate aminotransferase family protein [Promethearchaeia archaeon]
MKREVKSHNWRFLTPIGGFHGVSAVFPRFQDIIDYEEDRFSVYQGYPRFVTHPAIRNLEDQWKEKFDAVNAISFHSYRSSIFFLIDYFFRKGDKIYIDSRLTSKIFTLLNQSFPDILSKVTKVSEADILIFNKPVTQVKRSFEDKILISLLDNPMDEKDFKFKGDFLICHDPLNDIGVILKFNDQFNNLTLLRRHCGFNVSSRKICGNNETLIREKSKLKDQLKKQITHLENVETNYCYFYPSGMAAVFISIFSLLSSQKPNFIGLGSLYVDTLKILEKWSEKYGLSKTDFIRDAIEKTLKERISEKTAGVIVEIPSNPLIQLVDIKEVINTVHLYGGKVIVDNTIATPYNFNPFDYGTDIVVHSSTKFLNGKNDHIGGIIITKEKELGEKIRKFNNLFGLDMAFNDIRTLSENIKGFERRMERINKNTEIIAKYLNNHEYVGKVYYPSLADNPDREILKKYLKGGSGLLSFVLKNSNIEVARQFYNNVLPPILKGPSLGSERSLLSPYVMMTHYKYSETELKHLGLNRYLMRLSVGTEPFEDIIYSLKYALNSLK